MDFSGFVVRFGLLLLKVDTKGGGKNIAGFDKGVASACGVIRFRLQTKKTEIRRLRVLTFFGLMDRIR